MTRRRLGVLGSPIEHSLSPTLHAAAYATLGLPWSYDRVEVGRGGLSDFTAGLGSEWRGLSLTMPLKDEAVALADELDDAARLTNAVNTLVFGPVVRGYNTDVPGIVDAFVARGVAPRESALVIGAGATARSVVIALARMGVTHVDVLARRAEAADEVIALAVDTGLSADRFAEGADEAPSVVVSTLPGGAAADLPELGDTAGSTLFDVAYSAPDGPVRRWWAAAGGAPARVDGLDMLVHQALRQIRLFVADDIEQALRDEAGVLRAMRASVGRS